MSGTTGIVVACPCGEVYEVRPEYAGRLLECPSCRRHLRAGQTPGALRASAPGVDAAFDRDVFLLRERIFTITSKYEVWTEAGTPILYVERPTYPIRTLAAYVVAIIATLMVTGWAAAPLARGPIHLALHLALSQRRPFVVELLAPGQSELELGATLLKV